MTEVSCALSQIDESALTVCRSTLTSSCPIT